MLNTYAADECCSEGLAAALRDGLEGSTWQCPACLVDWRAEVMRLEHGDGVKHWSPHHPVLMFKL